MRQQGFTLVEILVVVVIMAIVISLAVLSIGVAGRDTQLDDESRRIAGLVGLLHERALLEGRDFGMRIEPAAYEFLVYDTRRDRWFSFDQEHEFRHRELPKGVTFQLELDSHIVVLKPIDSSVSKPNDTSTANRRSTTDQTLPLSQALSSNQTSLADQASANQPPPQIAIAASGEGTPYRLTLLREATQAKATVSGDAMGKTSSDNSNKVDKPT